MRSQISYGNGMYKSTDAGKTWTHIGLEPTRVRSARSSSIRATRTSCSSPRSVTSMARTRIAACTARATAARRGRRCCSRATTSARSTWPSIRRPADHLRRAVEHPPSAVEHLSAVVRPGQRTLQVDRRRDELAAADERSAVRRRRPHRYRGRANESFARLRDRRRQGRRAVPVRRCRRDVAKASADSRIWGRGWYFGKVIVDPKNADLVYVIEHRRLPIARRRPDVRRAVQGIARRRRLSPALDLPRRRQPDDSRRRPGRGDQRRRLERSSDVELVAESADRAGLPRRRRQRVSLLGDRRAAGQRRGPRALARPVRRPSRCATGSRSAPAARPAIPRPIR